MSGKRRPAGLIREGLRCPVAGKVTYASRLMAKTAARQLYPGEHLTAYACEGHWHLGHLPQAALLGVKGRREVYGR